MGIFRRRPSSWDGNGGNGGQTHSTTARPLLLGDQLDTTYVWMEPKTNSQAAGTALAYYPAFATGTQIPAGKKIVAVIQGHRTSAKEYSAYYGYASTWLRLSAVRLLDSVVYQPDLIEAWHDQVGAPVYKSGNVPWTDSDLNQMSSDATIVPRGGGSRDRAYLSEMFMDVVYEEALTAPSSPVPAASATIDTSTVTFSAISPAPQAEQTVRLIVQVSQTNTFTDPSTKQLVGAFSNATAAGSRVTYNPATQGDTDLGPGTWFRRYKVQDVIGNETAWSATDSFSIVHAALPSPANVSPAPGSISTTPYGIRSSRIDTAASDNRTVGVEWQFSKAADFSTGIVTWKNILDRVVTGTVIYNALPDVTVTAGRYGAKVATADPSQYLSQGSWNMRSRTVDKWNQVSAWSTAATFTVAHQPVAQNVSPASDAVIDQTVTPVRWTFGDPWDGDAQTAYQIQVYTAANALVYDSGKVGGTSGKSLQAMMNIPVANLYQRLRLVVRLWDKDDVTSATVSSYYFIFSNSPAITQAFPALNQEIATGQPTFTWSPGIARPGTVQRSFELKVYNRVTGALIYTSGVVNSQATQHTPPQTILRNGGSYQETLRIVDSDNLSSTLTRNFTAVYQAPADVPVTVDPSTYDLNGYVDVQWPSAIPDTYFIQWNLYRRPSGTVDWDLITTIDDSAVRFYHDWAVPAVGEFQYSVTQVADRFGYILESGQNEAAATYYISSDDFWLIDPDNESNNIRLYSVVGNPYKAGVYERTSYVVKDRGTRTNFGTRIGNSGTINCKIRPYSGYSPSQLIEMLEAMAQRRYWVNLRDPFGRLTRVTIGDIDVDPMAGMGTEEFADVSFPYTEVY